MSNNDVRLAGRCFALLIERRPRRGGSQASDEAKAVTYHCPNPAGGDPGRFAWTSETDRTLLNAAVYSADTLEKEP